MKLTLRVYRDEADALRAEWKDAPVRGEYLKRFLEDDLNSDEAYLTRILSEGRALSAGKSKSYRVSGNSFALRLTPKTAALFPNYDEQAKAFSLPLSEFLKIVKRWQKLLGA